MIEIDILEGPNRGERVRIAGRTAWIGRDAACAVVLAEGAGRQAAIVAGPQGLRFVAHDRASDSAVGGLPVVGGEAPLASGAVVRVGAARLRVWHAGAAHVIREPQAPYALARESACSNAAQQPTTAPSGRPEPCVEIVARSSAMREVVALLHRVAATDSTVLLTGESGCGKEVAAQLVQANGPRAHRPFVTVNSAALSETLLESELFGHERGAFTGAIATKRGLFELARGGTLFLDEIGEIHPAMQAKLLRVLEAREFRRVGGGETLRADVRIIAATNRDLRARVREGRFREDLYYRLAVVEIRIPPLRERGADLRPLCDQILSRLAKDRGIPVPSIDDAAFDCMRRYPFPGNIRELKNALERALIVGDGRTIALVDLPEAMRRFEPAPPEAKFPTLAEAESRHISTALRVARGNKSRAAELLGIHRKTLYLKLAEHRIRLPDLFPEDERQTEPDDADGGHHLQPSANSTSTSMG
jgi:transcriptional regulator with PAS, ATPase and Fis domain